MANYATLKAAIAAAIKENGNNEITGNLLKQQLLAMVNSLGIGYQYIDIATPTTNPGTPDQNVFYIASTAGTYANFGGLVLDDGEISILKYNGVWSKDNTGYLPVKIVDNALYIGDVEAGILLTIADSARYIQASVDKDGRVYEAVGVDGNKYHFLPQIFKEKAIFRGGVDGVIGFDVENNDNFVFLIKDISGLSLCGIRKDGQFVFGGGVLDGVLQKIKIQIGNAITKYDNSYNIRHIAFGADNSLSYVVVGRGCDGAMNPYCIGIGYGTLKNNTGIKNISVGSNNMENATGHDNTSIGYHALFRNTSGNFNTAAGSESQDDNTEGNGNVSMGFCSLQRNNLGNYNVAIGYFALLGGVDEHFDPDNLKTVQNNVAIGAMALVNALTGSNGNVAIGHNTMTSFKQYRNCVAIGESVDCEKDNQTVIGNDNTVETVVRGDLIVKGTDGKKRQIVFNQDGTCSWIEITEN